MFEDVDEKILNYYLPGSEKDHILLIGHSCNMGGAEILLKNMIPEFTKQDVEIVLFVKNDGILRETYEKYAPTFIVDDDEKIEYYLNELKKYGFKIAITNTVVSGDFTPFLKKHGFYTISLVHELPNVIKSLHVEYHSKMIAEYSDLVVFPSEFVADKFENMFELKNKKLIKAQGLYNRYSNFNKKESRKKIMEMHNIPEDHQIILSVGRKAKIKGIDLFMEVSDKLRNNKITFIWIGFAKEQFLPIFINQMNELNNENLIIIGLGIDSEILMTYYDACDIFLLPSREDPFPSVVLEAFNAKMPVIAFKNAGGFQDIVINDVSGYLVEYGSVNELSKKIRFLLENDKLREELGNNAKKICDEYDFEEYIKTLIAYAINGKKILKI